MYFCEQSTTSSVAQRDSKAISAFSWAVPVSTLSGLQLDLHKLASILGCEGPRGHREKGREALDKGRVSSYTVDVQESNSYSSSLFHSPGPAWILINPRIVSVISEAPAQSLSLFP